MPSEEVNQQQPNVVPAPEPDPEKKWEQLCNRLCGDSIDLLEELIDLLIIESQGQKFGDQGHAVFVRSQSFLSEIHKLCRLLHSRDNRKRTYDEVLMEQVHQANFEIPANPRFPY